ncbi:MAG: hypothetical protein KBT12_02220 [Bacteroidales bacterium]|nr:hypothetical protein [Candidatus Physcousia equi]
MELIRKKKNYLIPRQYVVEWESEQQFLTISGHGSDIPTDPDDDEGWGSGKNNVHAERFTNYNAFDTTW